MKGEAGSPAEKKRPAKPRAPKPPKITEPTTGADGWTLHPPSLIYRRRSAPAAHPWSLMLVSRPNGLTGHFSLSFWPQQTLPISARWQTAPGRSG